MADIITFFEENGLFNTIGCDSIVYYDRHTHEFVVFSAEDDVRSDDLIETPYRESFRKSVWNHFYSHLTENDLAIIEEFDGGLGFFDFMRTTGLYGQYEASYNHVAERILDAWQSEHDITISIA